MKIKAKMYLFGASVIIFTLILAATVLRITTLVTQALDNATIGLELVTSATELSLITEEYLDYSYSRMAVQWQQQHEEILAIIDADAVGEFDALRQDLNSLSEDFAALNAFKARGEANLADVNYQEILAGQMRLATSRIVTNALGSQNEIYRQIEQIQQEAIRLVFGMVAVITAVAAIITHQLIRSVVSPLDGLIHGIRLLGEGQLDHRIQPQAYDELGELTLAINDMAVKRQRSDLRYRSLFEYSPISLWEEDYSEAKEEIDRLLAEGITDLKSYLSQNKEILESLIRKVKVLDVNKQTVKLYAAPDKNHFLGYFKPKDTEAYNAFIRQFLAIANKETSLEFSSRSYALDGRSLQIVLKWNVLPGYMDDYSRVIVSLVDITEIWEAEQALEKSLRRLKALFDHSQDTILLANDEARYVEVNQAATALTGYTQEQLLQLSVWDLTPDPHLEQGLEMWRQFIAAGKSEGDFPIRRADGQVIQTEFRSVANITPNLHLSIIRDVTERRKREEALRTSEEKYRNLVEASHDLIWSVDNDGRIMFMNQASRRIYGRSPEEMIGCLYTDFTPPGQTEINAEYWQMHLVDGAVINYENWVLHKDGTPVLLNTNAILLRDDDGKVVGSMGTSQDITERKRMEQTLLAREKDLLEAQRITRLGSWQLDIQNNVLTWSDQVYKIFGVEKQSFGATFEAFLSFVHPNDRQMMLAAQLPAERGDAPLNIEHRIVRPDGKVRYVHERAEAVFDGQERPVRLVGTVHDITERKEAELELRETNERLQAIIQASPVAIIVMTLDGIVSLWSPAAEYIFGWQAEEIIGQPYPLANDPVSAAEFNHNLRLLAMGQSIIGLETRRFTKDGTQIDVSINFVPVQNDAGNSLFALAMLGNITTRKQQERAAQMYARRLEALHQIDRAILKQQSPEKIAQAAVDHLAQMIHCQSITVDWVNETAEKVMVLAENKKGDGPTKVSKQGEVRSWENGEFNSTLHQGKMILIPELAELEQRSPRIEQLLQNGVRSYLQMPLMAQNQLIGSLTLCAGKAAGFNDTHVTFVKEAANQVAIALQQARLYEIAQEQRQLAESLRDTAVSLSRVRSIDEIYDVVLTNAGRICPHDFRVIVCIEDGTANVVHLDGSLADAVKNQILATSLPDALFLELKTALAEGRTIIMTNAEEVKRWFPVDEIYSVCSAIVVPILIRSSQVFGILALASFQPDNFDTSLAQKLSGFAEQLTLALERFKLTADLQAHATELELRVAERTAQLEDQFRQQASFEERQRLARELHDVVSQSLFSASVIAETLPRLVNNKPDALLDGLKQLHYLTRGALAEMRTLLLELRPNRLHKTPLGVLLQGLTDSVGGRLGFDLEVSITDKRNLPDPVKHAIYRVAQEALNNIVRHAHATAVRLNLNNLQNKTTLLIQDDGLGFDRNQIPPDHLGLGIMEERISNIGGSITIQSLPGKGTTIALTWSDK